MAKLPNSEQYHTIEEIRDQCFSLSQAFKPYILYVKCHVFCGKDYDYIFDHATIFDFLGHDIKKLSCSKKNVIAAMENVTFTMENIISVK